MKKQRRKSDTTAYEVKIALEALKGQQSKVLIKSVFGLSELDVYLVAIAIASLAIRLKDINNRAELKV